MPWKKDLAKLKQDLKQEDLAPPKPPPPPKAAPAAPVSRSIEEEDEIFLNAMGLKPQTRKAAPRSEAPPAPLVRAEPTERGTAPEAFSSAMGDLKGMKPLRRHPAQDQPERPTPPKAAAPPPEPVAAPTKAAAPTPPSPLPEAIPETVPTPAPQPSPEPAALKRAAPGARETRVPSTPEGAPGCAIQINLAAGMAIEVDGLLDLRGHARSDGEERLKERILDGHTLGWRTLHVLLGPSPDLTDMLLALLRSPEGRCVARYAQAPIPMGGPHAWILYFRPSGSTEAL